jgi:DNA-binding NarL/FixJ family response regulator
LDVLTEREQEVLIGVQEGLKDQEIAEKLFISITTVRTHLRKAYSKIDARNRAEAIQFISKFEI